MFVCFFTWALLCGLVVFDFGLWVGLFGFFWVWVFRLALGWDYGIVGLFLRVGFAGAW